MATLHEASLYLLEHWDTYIEMQKVSSEINTNYLFPLLNGIKEKLIEHQAFPEDWNSDIEIDDDNETANIIALPTIWKDWNDKNDYLAYVYFGNLEVSELMASDREERSCFSLEISLGNRQDELSKASAKKLWEVSKDYISQLEGFEWQEEYNKETCFYKYIDKMALSTIKDKNLLISFVVNGMISLISVVDQIKKDHFSKKMKIKDSNE